MTREKYWIRFALVKVNFRRARLLWLEKGLQPLKGREIIQCEYFYIFIHLHALF